MTYRSDRDAAKHRITRLERELAEARANLEHAADAPAPPSPTRRRWRWPTWPTWPARWRIPLVYAGVAVAAAALAFVVIRPERMGHPAYSVLVVIVAALVGVYFVFARKQFTTKGVGPDLVMMLCMGLPMLLAFGGLLRCVAGEREVCRQDVAAAADRPTQFSGRVTASERRDDVVVGAPCTLTLASLYVDACGDTCNATLRCGDAVLLDGSELETCNMVDGKVRVVRDASPGQIGIRVSFDLATGSGGGFVYDEPRLGRLPWRIDLALGDSRVGSGARAEHE